MLTEIAQLIKEHDRFGVTAHLSPEADALGAVLGVRTILEQLGKTPVPIMRDPVPRTLAFLPGADRVQAPEDSDRNEIEVWIVLDCGQLNRVGEPLAEAIREHPRVVNIDHHGDNPGFGHVNWIEPRASTTMLVATLAEHLGVELSPDLATLLYSGIVADTNSFRNDNVTPDVLATASSLLAHGARAREITIHLFERRSLAETRLLGRALAQVQSGDGLIWSSLAQDDFAATGTDMSETEGIVEGLRAVEGARIAVLFKEMDDGRVKVSLRAKQGPDVSRIARQFDGGGHAQAAGCLVAGELAEVESRVLEAAREALAGHAV